jgi:hypothetical protein
MKKASTKPVADDAIDFWQSVERSAATVRDLPAWMKVGLAVDATNFVVTGSDNADTPTGKKAARSTKK